MFTIFVIQESLVILQKLFQMLETEARFHSRLQGKGWAWETAGKWRPSVLRFYFKTQISLRKGFQIRDKVGHICMLSIVTCMLAMENRREEEETNKCSRDTWTQEKVDELALVRNGLYLPVLLQRILQAGGRKLREFSYPFSLCERKQSTEVNLGDNTVSSISRNKVSTNFLGE